MHTQAFLWVSLTCVTALHDVQLKDEQENQRKREKRDVGNSEQMQSVLIQTWDWPFDMCKIYNYVLYKHRCK